MPDRLGALSLVRGIRSQAGSSEEEIYFNAFSTRAMSAPCSSVRCRSGMVLPGA